MTVMDMYKTILVCPEDVNWIVDGQKSELRRPMHAGESLFLDNSGISVVSSSGLVRYSTGLARVIRMKKGDTLTPCTICITDISAGTWRNACSQSLRRQGYGTYAIYMARMKGLYPAADLISGNCWILTFRANTE